MRGDKAIDYLWELLRKWSIESRCHSLEMGSDCMRALHWSSIEPMFRYCDQSVVSLPVETRRRGREIKQTAPTLERTPLQTLLRIILKLNNEFLVYRVLTSGRVGQREPQFTKLFRLDCVHIRIGCASASTPLKYVNQHFGAIDLNVRTNNAIVCSNQTLHLLMIDWHLTRPYIWRRVGLSFSQANLSLDLCLKASDAERLLQNCAN